MFESLKSHWQTLRQRPAGQRFARYYEQRRSGRRAHPFVSSAWVALGAVLSLIGAVLLVAPGPGIPFLLVGTCLMARESLSIARSLDRMELRARKLRQVCARRLARFRA